MMYPIQIGDVLQLTDEAFDQICANNGYERVPGREVIVSRSNERTNTRAFGRILYQYDPEWYWQVNYVNSVGIGILVQACMLEPINYNRKGI